MSFDSKVKGNVAEIILNRYRQEENAPLLEALRKTVADMPGMNHYLVPLNSGANDVDRIIGKAVAEVVRAEGYRTIDDLQEFTPKVQSELQRRAAIVPAAVSAEKALVRFLYQAEGNVYLNPLRELIKASPALGKLMDGSDSMAWEPVGEKIIANVLAGKSEAEIGRLDAAASFVNDYIPKETLKERHEQEQVLGQHKQVLGGFMSEVLAEAAIMGKQLSTKPSARSESQSAGKYFF